LGQAQSAGKKQNKNVATGSAKQKSALPYLSHCLLYHILQKKASYNFLTIFLVNSLPQNGTYCF